MPLARKPMPRGASTLKRSAMVSATKPKTATPRAKKCANRDCRAPYQPDPKQPFLNWCSADCALVIAMAGLAKKKAAKAKAERAADRKKKEGFKRRADHIEEAQKAFNAFIRLRDQLAGYPCISSGRPLDWSGNAVDAGHYRSRGSAPHLRFDERNCHAQAKQENRYASGNATDYRIGLIGRIGLAEVEALECDQDDRPMSVDDLKAIRALYVTKLKKLKAEHAQRQP